MVQKDPEDLFRNISDLLTPNSVGTRTVHVGDEDRELGVVFWWRITNVGE